MSDIKEVESDYTENYKQNFLELSSEVAPATQQEDSLCQHSTFTPGRTPVHSQRQVNNSPFNSDTGDKPHMDQRNSFKDTLPCANQGNASHSFSVVHTRGRVKNGQENEFTNTNFTPERRMCGNKEREQFSVVNFTPKRKLNNSEMNISLEDNTGKCYRSNSIFASNKYEPLMTFLYKNDGRRDENARCEAQCTVSSSQNTFPPQMAARVPNTVVAKERIPVGSSNVLDLLQGIEDELFDDF